MAGLIRSYTVEWYKTEKGNSMSNSESDEATKTSQSYPLSGRQTQSVKTAQAVQQTQTAQTAQAAQQTQTTQQVQARYEAEYPHNGQSPLHDLTHAQPIAQWAVQWPAFEKPPLWAPWYGISFGQAVVRFFRKTFIFHGRASRGEYWWAWLFSLLLLVAVIFATYVVSSVFINIEGSRSLRDVFMNSPQIDEIAYHLASALQLVLFLPNLSLSVRRLHDENRRGWWIVLPIILMVGAVFITLAVLIVMSIGDDGTDTYANQAIIVAVLVFSGLYLLSGLVSIMLMIGASDPRGARFDKPDHRDSRLSGISSAPHQASSASAEQSSPQTRTSRQTQSLSQSVPVQPVSQTPHSVSQTPQSSQSSMLQPPMQQPLSESRTQ